MAQRPQLTTMGVRARTAAWHGGARSNVHAVVLAGSHSWRRFSLESQVARPLLPVAQVPLIGHLLDWIGTSELQNITVCSNGMSELIQRHLESMTDLSGLLFRDDLIPRGPAGSAADASAQTAADTFLVAESTFIPMVDLDRLLTNHRASRAAVTIVVQPDDPSRRTPEDRAIPAGLYVFDRKVFDRVPAFGFSDIKESLIPCLYRAGEFMRVHVAEACCPRVIDARSYLGVNHWMISRIARHLQDPAMGRWAEWRVKSGVIWHSSAKIDSGALLLGPLLIGPRAHIMSGATVIGPTSIGADTVVRAGAVVTRSVIWEHSTIDSGAMTDRAVVVDHMHVERGVNLVEAIRLPADEIVSTGWTHRPPWPAVRPKRAVALVDATAP